MAGKFRNGLSKQPGGVYHYCIRVNGRQCKGSTRATDLGTARRVLEDIRRKALVGEEPRHRVPSLGEIRDAWLDTYKVVHSQKHWRDVETVSRLWILPECNRVPIDQVSTSHALLLRTRMLEAGRSPVTVNDMLKILKLLGNFAVKQGHIQRLPFKVEFLKVQKKPRPVLGVSQVREFFAAMDREAKNPHIPVLVRVMLGLGLRESEALGMRWEWLDAQSRTYTVGKSKGKEARVLPVPEWVWEAIHSVKRDESGWVFPAEDGKPHRTQFCKRVLRRVVHKLGAGHLTQHRLRATFATLHAQAGTPITEIQSMLGHMTSSQKTRPGIMRVLPL